MCSDGEETPAAGVWRRKKIVREDCIAQLWMVRTGHIERGGENRFRGWEIVEW